MVKQGRYELDSEGNLVDVGTGGSDEITPRGWPKTPAAKAKILRQIAVAETFGFIVLLVLAIATPEIRTILLVVAAAYALMTIPVYLFYRRLLDRRIQPPEDPGTGTS
jgi:hypothetical protein